MQFSIGVGYDLLRSDFWSFRHNYPLGTFSDSVPDECFMESPCSYAVVKKTEDFNSSRAWTQQFTSSFGLNASVEAKKVSAGLSLLVKNSFNHTWSRDSQVTRSSIAKNKACYQFRDHCLGEPDYLQGSLRNLLERLPTDASEERTLKVWAMAFLKRFGTHVAVKSEHGGMLQAIVTSDAGCKMHRHCREMGGSLKLGFMKYANLSIAGDMSSCKMSKSCEKTLKTSCAAVGGGASAGVDLCGKDVSEETINAFLDGADVAGASSIIHLELRPMSEVLMHMGYWEQGLLVEKAAEYYACTGKSHTWDQASQSCKCTLKCQNGGTLDSDACTCSCRGDEDHGFTGEDCSETYGKCVRGVGSSTTPTALGRACVEGNWCGGVEKSVACGNTDVCCNRDEGGVCCPLGSSCDCFGARMGRFCKCMKPHSGKL